jgi:hypothetical protein
LIRLAIVLVVVVLLALLGLLLVKLRRRRAGPPLAVAAELGGVPALGSAASGAAVGSDPGLGSPGLAGDRGSDLGVPPPGSKPEIPIETPATAVADLAAVPRASAGKDGEPAPEPAGS